MAVAGSADGGLRLFLGMKNAPWGLFLGAYAFLKRKRSTVAVKLAVLGASRCGFWRSWRIRGVGRGLRRLIVALLLVFLVLRVSAVLCG